MTRAETVSLYWALVRPELESCVQFWSTHNKKEVEGLEQAQRRAAELRKDLKHKFEESS